MTTMIDPVCGMQVEPHRNEVAYLGISYAFCSQQCQQRFLANPHLYIGTPDHPSVKQQGKAVFKSRRIHLDAPLTPEQAAILAGELGQMMGIAGIKIKGRHVEVVYDLLQATAEQIEQRLVELGVRLGENWPERLRQAFVHYTEECELGNLGAEEMRRYCSPLTDWVWERHYKK